MAGVNDRKQLPAEDTLPETPSAKASDPRISIPGEWKPPPRRSTPEKATDLAQYDRGGSFPDAVGDGGADFGFGGAHVRTISVHGPLAFVLALGVVAVIGLIIALVVVFAVGVGAALAVGGAAAALLGVGAAKVRRRLPGSRRATLDGGRREP